MIKKIKLSIKTSKKILYRKDLYKIRHKDQMKIFEQRLITIQNMENNLSDYQIQEKEEELGFSIINKNI